MQSRTAITFFKPYPCSSEPVSLKTMRLSRISTSRAVLFSRYKKPATSVVRIFKSIVRFLESGISLHAFNALSMRFDKTTIKSSSDNGNPERSSSWNWKSISFFTATECFCVRRISTTFRPVLVTNIGIVSFLVTTLHTAQLFHLVLLVKPDRKLLKADSENHEFSFVAPNRPPQVLPCFLFLV